MAKESFDRSKPHINVGTQSSGDAQIALVESTPSGPFPDVFGALDSDDGIKDATAPVPIGVDDLLICYRDEAGNEMCADTSNQGTWRWDDFLLPIFETPTGDPLLVQLDLNGVGGSVGPFSLNDMVSVTSGNVSGEVFTVSVNNGDFDSLLAPTGPNATAYTGTAKVVGFAEFNVPEPTSLLLVAAAGMAVLSRRLRR